jgi:hypothetical protein
LRLPSAKFTNNEVGTGGVDVFLKLPSANFTNIEFGLRRSAF